MRKVDIIVPVHGILVDVSKPDDWPELFEKWLCKEYAIELFERTLYFKQFSYGYLTPVISWLTTVFNWFKLHTLIDRLSLTRFKKFIKTLKKQYPNARIHVIAHSFGTWTTQKVLEMHPSVEIQSLTLVGSVISAHIRKNYIDEMLETNQIKACFSWSSHNDKVVRFAPPPFGHLGYWGFLTDDPEDRITPKSKPFKHLEIHNHYTLYGHNKYFEDSTFAHWMGDIHYANSLK